MDNLTEVLIPIFFFIIWVLSSIANAKKKRPQQPPTQKQPQPSSHRPYERPIPLPQPQRPSPQRSANPMDDLKRTLETIFEDMGRPEYEEEELEEEEYETPTPEPKAEEVYTAPVQARPVKESYKERAKQEQIQLRRFYDNYQSEERSNLELSLTDLRKAVIYTEILAKPLALREEG